MPESLKQRYLRYTDMMEKYGYNLGPPHTKPMGDGLFELRISGKDGIARVFYCIMAGHTIIILHCFIKKTQKTPYKELEIAIKRMKEIKNG